MLSNVMKSPLESLAESAWNVSAVNQILSNTDLGDELKIASKVCTDFNVTPDDQEIGEFLIQMPFPISKESLISFKWIIINKETCQYIDDMKKPPLSEGFKLVDTTSTTNDVTLGINPTELKKAWEEIKKIKIQANEIEIKPFQFEVIRYIKIIITLSDTKTSLECQEKTAKLIMIQPWNNSFKTF